MTSPPSAERHGLDVPPPPRPRRGEILSYDEGRICASKQCRTLLSRYNKDALCWAHADEILKRQARG